MTIKVIGAGFGRTGTLSLKKALEELGYGDCYHMVDVYKHKSHAQQWRKAKTGADVDWHDMLSGYQSIVDFPGCLFYKELLQAFPDAKVILTERDADSWYESANKTILSIKPSILEMIGMTARAPFSNKARQQINVGMMHQALIKNGLFDNRADDSEWVKSVYLDHINEVKSLVPQDQLLVFKVQQGWQPLCEFLDKPTPKTDFPRSNAAQNFQDFRAQFMNA